MSTLRCILIFWRYFNRSGWILAIMICFELYKNIEYLYTDCNNSIILLLLQKKISNEMFSSGFVQCSTQKPVVFKLNVQSTIWIILSLKKLSYLIYMAIFFTKYTLAWMHEGYKSPFFKNHCSNFKTKAETAFVQFTSIWTFAIYIFWISVLF